MSVPGRSRSIEVIYSEPKIDYLEAAIKIVIYEIHTKEKEGDILLFLTDQEVGKKFFCYILFKILFDVHFFAGGRRSLQTEKWIHRPHGRSW